LRFDPKPNPLKRECVEVIRKKRKERGREGGREGGRKKERKEGRKKRVRSKAGSQLVRYY